MTTPLYLLHIEIDGHFHGSPEVPKPWVARITGTCERYGLAREFLDPMNDWRRARRAWSGNVYGVTSTFALRDGNVYEVSRLRGSSSKRRVVREFYAIEGGKRRAIEPLEALARAEQDDGPAAVVRLDEDPDDMPWVAELRRLGDQPRLGFVVVDGRRHYRLREGRLYHLHGSPRGGFACVHQSGLERLSERQALERLLSKCH